MDIYTEGLRQAASEYGIKRLAYELGMSETRLYKKLDPDGSINLTLEDFFRLSLKLKDARCIHSLLDDLDMVAVPRAQANVSRGDVLSAVLEKQMESGRLASLIHQVIEGDKEAASLDAQFRAIEAATATLKAALRRPALKAVGN